MDANSPAEGKLDCSSCDDAVKNFVIQEEGEDIENDVHPFTAFLVSHDIEDEDEDEVESEDEEWQPHVRWICINCTMPNPEDEDHCWKCNEQCDSNILEQKLASVPSELTGVECKYLITCYSVPGTPEACGCCMLLCRTDVLLDVHWNHI